MIYLLNMVIFPSQHPPVSSNMASWETPEPNGSLKWENHRTKREDYLSKCDWLPEANPPFGSMWGMYWEENCVLTAPLQFSSRIWCSLPGPAGPARGFSVNWEQKIHPVHPDGWDPTHVSWKLTTVVYNPLLGTVLFGSGHFPERLEGSYHCRCWLRI